MIIKACNLKLQTCSLNIQIMENRTMIGMIGGTGWASTVEYYSLLNEKVNARLGGFEYARCLIYSLNYGEINALNERDDLDSIYLIVLDAARTLQRAGAGCIVLCANTLHLFADRLEKDIPVPLIHIADATALRIREDGFTKVGLMGTKRTMLGDFYHSRLQRYGIVAIVPDEKDKDFIEFTIRQEMVRGIVRPEHRIRYLEIIQMLIGQGAQGVVLGCTEIPLLVKQEHTPVKLYDTTEIHAEKAVDFFVGRL
jgi:aspartate racemase